VSLAERVQAILEAAAVATGTSVETEWDGCPPYLPLRTNRSLAARYAVNLTDRDRQVLPAGAAPRELAASTDMGNISVRVPSIHPLLSVAPVEVIIHTAEFAKWAASKRADDGVVDGAIALARTGADYLGDATLRRSAAHDFDFDGGVLDAVVGRLTRLCCAFPANWVHNIGRWRFPAADSVLPGECLARLLWSCGAVSQVRAISVRHRCFDGGKELL
jgi:hypothetical protein